MGSKQESLNKRVRETIANLSDKELGNRLRASAQNYTPFARQVLEEEQSRRTRKNAIKTDPAQVNGADLATLREGNARDQHSGCYIEVWTDKNFEGEYLKIEGPAEYQALEFASLALGDSISSLRIGPGAFVLVYAEEEFKGKMISLGPNQEVWNLEELRFNDEVESIRLVNSFKIFDGFRSESAVKLPGKQETKRAKRPVRGRIRGR